MYVKIFLSDGEKIEVRYDKFIFGIEDFKFNDNQELLDYLVGFLGCNNDYIKIQNIEKNQTIYINANNICKIQSSF